MQVTPYQKANELLESLLVQIRGVLSERLVGLYLFGSLAKGDFDPESSDVDLLAATSSDISDAEAEALCRMHADVASAFPEWDDRIDVAYLSVEGLRTFRQRESRIGIISPGEPFHMDVAGSDWLINWYGTREWGICLWGPPPKVLIPPISKEEFIESVREYAVWLCGQVNHGTRAEQRKQQAYAILAMCRALYAHRLGEHISKERAGLWAQRELPEYAGLVERALVWRRAWREEGVDHAATRPETIRFVNLVRELVISPAHGAPG